MEKNLANDAAYRIELTPIGSLKDGLPLVEGSGYDILIADLGTPSPDESNLIGMMASRAPRPAIIALVDARETGIRALAMGAEDYLVRGRLDAETLSRSIRYAATIMDARNAAQRQNEEMQMQTAALQAANEELIQARRAALNIMEDAITANRETERERNSLQAVMTALPVGIAILDAQGGNIRSNPMYDQVWGDRRPVVHSVDDYAKFRAWHEDTGLPVQPDEWASAMAVRKGESVIGQLMRIQRFDGTIGYVINGAAPIRDIDGRITGCAVAIQDITPLREAERALQRSARRFELLARTAGDLLKSKEPRNIIESLCREVMAFMDCQAFFNFMTDDAAKKLRLNAWAGIPDEEARRIEWLDYGVAVCGCAARDRCRIVTEHINERFDERTELVRSYGIRAYACHPMLDEHERVIGTLSFGTTTRDTFSDEDLALMKAVADQVAVAMIRIRDEEHLRAGTATLEGILNATKESIWLFSPEGVILMANDTAIARMKKKREEVVGYMFNDVIGNEIARSRGERLREALAGAKPVQFEDERDGIFFHHNFYPVIDDHGAVTAVASFSRDVTESKRAEEALRESEERYRTLFETIRHGVVYQAANGAIITANPAAQRILGLSLEQMRGATSDDPMWGAVHEDGSPYPGGEHPSMAALTTGIPVYNEIMGLYRRESNSYTWISISAIPLFRPGENRPYQVYTTFEDITERKNAEKSIRRLASFPELNPNPVVEIDFNGAVRYSNPTAMRLFPGLQLQALTHPYLDGLERDLKEFIDHTKHYTVRDVTVGQASYNQYLQYLNEDRCVRIYGFDITHRKRAEEALRASEVRFRTLFATMTEGVIIHELLFDEQGRAVDYRILETNPAMKRHTGIEPEEAAGRLASELYGTDTAPYLDIYAAIVATGIAAQFETRFKPLERYFSISAFRLTETQFATVFEDITERRMSEEEMRLTLAATTDGIWKSHYRTGELYFSPRYYTMLGYEPDEFPPTHEAWQELIHPDDRARVAQTMADFDEADGDIYYCEFRMRTRQGDYRTIRSRGRTIRDEDGRRQRIIGNHDDVTDEKATERQLMETNVLLSTIVDYTDILIAYLDRDFTVIRVNQAFARFDGHDTAFYPGKNHFEINIDDRLKSACLDVVATGTPYFKSGQTFVYPAKPDSGSRFWDLSIIPIIGDDHRVTSLVLTMADVTNYKKQEAVLREFNERLEHMVRQRTEELYSSNQNLRAEIERRIRYQSEKEHAYAELDTIFNSMSIGMTVTDLDCRYIRVNRRFTEMVNRPPGELLGTGCRELWKSALCDSDDCPVRRVLRGQLDSEAEMAYRNPDGREQLFQLSTVPYYGNNGEVFGIITNVIDITEKREIQHKLTTIIDDERKNISYELHDDLGQNLTAIGFILESIRQKIVGSPDVILQKLDEASDILQKAQTKTRSLSKLLSPVEIDSEGLQASLLALMRSFEKIYSLSCPLTVDEGFKISDYTTATSLYYIAREAGTNAVKHGKPKTISLHAFKDAASQGIAIRDDGLGAGNKNRETGIGIKIMKYRAQMIGATFSCGDSADGGFEVVVSLPLR